MDMNFLRQITVRNVRNAKLTFLQETNSAQNAEQKYHSLFFPFFIFSFAVIWINLIEAKIPNIPTSPAEFKNYRLPPELAGDAKLAALGITKGKDNSGVDIYQYNAPQVTGEEALNRLLRRVIRGRIQVIDQISSDCYTSK